MITIKSAIRLGFRLVAKNKSIFLILGVWESIKTLLVYFGVRYGIGWPLEGRFFIKFPVPRMWSTIDMILPYPLINPDGGYVLTLVQSKELLITLIWVVIVLAIDTFVRGIYINQIILAYENKKLTMYERIKQSLLVYNQFFILTLIIFVWSLLANFIQAAYAVTNYSQMVVFGLNSISTISATIFVFTDIAIIYNKTLTEALRHSYLRLVKTGYKVVGYLIIGAIILGLASVSINWATGSLPSLILAVFTFAFLASGLTAGVIYLYSAKDQIISET